MTELTIVTRLKAICNDTAADAWLIIEKQQKELILLRKERADAKSLVKNKYYSKYLTAHTLRLTVKYLHEKVNKLQNQLYKKK